MHGPPLVVFAIATGFGACGGGSNHGAPASGSDCGAGDDGGSSGGSSGGGHSDSGAPQGDSGTGGSDGDGGGVSLISGVRAFFTDLVSGPSSGGENGKGAYVTVYGNGFGASRGTSTVTIGSGAADNYPLWTETKITFQLGAAATTGNVVVHVSGKGGSNGLAFTVRAGNIFFVSSTGKDTNDGAFSTPWATIPQAKNSIQPGDIAYIGTTDEPGVPIPMASKKPKRRNTMDVDPSWLESEPEPEPEPAPRPPRVPRDLASELSPEKGPLAGPQRRETMEVQMDWLEPTEPEAEADEPKKRASEHPKKKPVIPPLLVAKPRGKLPPPLPRSEPPAPRGASRPPGRKGR
jgi:hypothetical protein